MISSTSCYEAKLSGIVKPSILFHLRNKPKSKEEIIMDISEQLGSLLINVPQNNNYYQLFYYNRNKKLEYNENQNGFYSQDIYFYKLKMIKFDKNFCQQTLINQLNNIKQVNRQSINDVRELDKQQICQLFSQHISQYIDQFNFEIPEYDADQLKRLNYYKEEERRKFEEYKDLKIKLDNLKAKEVSQKDFEQKEQLICTLNAQIDQKQKDLDEYQSMLLEKHFITKGDCIKDDCVNEELNQTQSKKQLKQEINLYSNRYIQDMRVTSKQRIGFSKCVIKNRDLQQQEKNQPKIAVNQKDSLIQQQQENKQVIEQNSEYKELKFNTQFQNQNYNNISNSQSDRIKKIIATRKNQNQKEFKLKPVQLLGNGQTFEERRIYQNIRNTKIELQKKNNKNQ